MNQALFAIPNCALFDTHTNGPVKTQCSCLILFGSIAEDTEELVPQKFNVSRFYTVDKMMHFFSSQKIFKGKQNYNKYI